MRARPLVIAARVTPAEKALIVAAAEKEGLSVDELVRRACLLGIPEHAKELRDLHTSAG